MDIWTYRQDYKEPEKEEIMDIYYLWLLYGESLIEFLFEAVEIIAIAFLLYREWVRGLEKKEE